MSLVRQRGFTLTELLVAMAIGLFVMAVLLGFLGRLLATETNMLRALSFQQELSAVMAKMVADLRRSGYTPLAKRADVALKFIDIVQPREDCLLYRYAHRQGHQARPLAADYAGFRLHHGRIQQRTSIKGCPSDDCHDCRRGRWSSLTDGQSWQVSKLVFSRHRGAVGQVRIDIVVQALTIHPPVLHWRLQAALVVPNHGD